MLRHFLWIKIVFGYLLMLSFNLAGETFYVDPGGNDITGDGSQVNPWKSLSYACSQVTTYGDVIHLNAGTYNETSQSILAQGVSIEGPTVDFEYPDFITSPTTIIKGWSESTQSIIFANSPLEGTNGDQEIRYVKFDSNGDHSKGVWFRHRSNVIVRNCEFVGFPYFGLEIVGQTFEGEPTIYATGVEVHDCRFTNNGSDKGGNWTTGGFQIGGLDGAKIYHNQIDAYLAEAQGIKYANWGYLKNIEIYKNNINTGYNSPPNIWNFAMELWNVKDESRIHHNICRGDINIDDCNYSAPATYSLEIDNNTIISDTFPLGTGSSGISFDDYCEGVIIHDNYISKLNMGIQIVLDNTKTGEPGIEGVNNFRIYRNVFDSLGVEYGKALFIKSINANQVIEDIYFWNNFSFGSPNFQTVVKIDAIHGNYNKFEVINNVFVNAFGPCIEFGDGGGSLNATIKSNVIYNCGDLLNENNVAIIASSNNHNYNPEIVRSGNRPDPFFRPSGSSSNLVNKGIDVGLPFNGAAPDIGVYEYEENAAPHAPTGLRIISN